MRFAIEPSRTSRVETFLLPSIGHALAFIAELEHADMGRYQPETGTADGESQLHPPAPQALCRASLFHHRPEGQKGPRYDQDLVFGYGICCRPSPPSTCWRTAPLVADPPMTGPATSTSSPCARDIDGVWESALPIWSFT